MCLECDGGVDYKFILGIAAMDRFGFRYHVKGIWLTNAPRLYRSVGGTSTLQGLFSVSSRLEDLR